MYTHNRQELTLDHTVAYLAIKGGNSEFKNGPYVFSMTIPFFELYKTTKGAIEASGEYSSSIEIWDELCALYSPGKSCRIWQ